MIYYTLIEGSLEEYVHTHTHTHTHTQTGSVPLGIAAEMGHIQTIQRLVGARANVNHQNKVMVIEGYMYRKYSLM